MAFEIDVQLGVSAPPNLLLIGTSSNTNSWADIEMVMPVAGNNVLAVNRRQLLHVTLRAISAPTTAQFGSTENISSYLLITRKGQNVTPHIFTQVFQTGLAGGGLDAQDLPVAQWINPLAFPLRGGDEVHVLVPGDANATPIQDWQLQVLLGAELKR